MTFNGSFLFFSFLEFNGPILKLGRLESFLMNFIMIKYDFRKNMQVLKLKD